MMERPTEFSVANDATENVHDAVSGFFQGFDIISAQGQEGLQACRLRFCLARLMTMGDEVHDLCESLKILSASFAPLEICFESCCRVNPGSETAHEVGACPIDGR